MSPIQALTEIKRNYAIAKTTLQRTLVSINLLVALSGSPHTHPHRRSEGRMRTARQIHR